MSQGIQIKIHNRYTKKEEFEKVYGDGFVRFAYGSKLGKLLGGFISSKFVSRMYGITQDMKISSKKVPQFMSDFSIKKEDYEKGSLSQNSIETSYKTFNEFFIRKFKSGLRKFPEKLEVMGAFSEARYFGHEKITNDLVVPVKGEFIKAIDLIGSEEKARDFIGGPFLIARLCPVDYHRYHYPDAGKTLDSFSIAGDLHSVNPLALKLKQDILIKNERRVSVLETENFGKIAYVEVGATCVGKIVQSFNEDERFQRGDEKGYFLFGGSTVIIFGESGKWSPSSDILENTKLGIETYIQLGDEIGSSVDN